MGAIIVTDIRYPGAEQVGTNPGRFGRITSSILNAFLKNSADSSADQAILSLFQIGLFTGDVNDTKRGHKMEPHIAVKWQEAILSIGIPCHITEQPVKSHPIFVFCADSIDRKVNHNGALEIKSTKHPSPLGGEVVKKRKDQCYWHMFLHNLRYCALAHGWNIDLQNKDDLALFEDPLKYRLFMNKIILDYAYIYDYQLAGWWKAAKPILFGIYEKYLRWYWEDDRSTERTQPLIDLIARDNAKRIIANNQRQQIGSPLVPLITPKQIESLFKRRPRDQDIFDCRIYRKAGFFDPQNIKRELDLFWFKNKQLDYYKIIAAAPLKTQKQIHKRKRDE